MFPFSYINFHSYINLPHIDPPPTTIPRLPRQIIHRDHPSYTTRYRVSLHEQPTHIIHPHRSHKSHQTPRSYPSDRHTHPIPTHPSPQHLSIPKPQVPFTLRPHLPLHLQPQQLPLPTTPTQLLSIKAISMTLIPSTTSFSPSATAPSLSSISDCERCVRLQEITLSQIHRILWELELCAVN